MFQDTRLSKDHFCNGGGILQNQLLICGGIQAYQTPTKYENDIVILGQQNQLLANNKLLQSREFSTSVVLNRLSMTGVRRSGSPGLAHFFLTSTR